jgi:YebC/PmpR family DNA-binding regulatory protein
MSGHNKWSKIKHKKAATDVEKSKIFSKIVRLITVEAKKAGGNKNNPGLRSAIEKAREVNMPSDNIERAIKKGASGNTEHMETLTYEAYGPGGCAIIIDTLTDNRNKTAAEIKYILSQNGANLAEIGAASWAFSKTRGGWTANTTVAIDESAIQTLGNIIKELEDCDEVQEVFTNAE